MMDTHRASYNRPHIVIGDKGKASKQQVIDKITASINALETWVKSNHFNETDNLLLVKTHNNLVKARRNLRILIAK